MKDLVLHIMLNTSTKIMLEVIKVRIKIKMTRKIWVVRMKRIVMICVMKIVRILMEEKAVIKM